MLLCLPVPAKWPWATLHMVTKRFCVGPPGCFWEASFLLSPYLETSHFNRSLNMSLDATCLPCMQPELHGGVDGAELTNSLLDLGYPNCLMLVSSLLVSRSSFVSGLAQKYSSYTCMFC